MSPLQQPQPQEQEKSPQEAGSNEQEQTPLSMQQQQQQQQLLQRTPLRSRVAAPQSAPPKSQTHMLLTSPEAARRSKESLEAIRVARTLKEGFSRLKARADPQGSQSHILSPISRRAMRTHSANNTSLASSAQPLTRHSSSLLRYGSAGSNTSIDSARSPSRRGGAEGLLLPPTTFQSPGARPMTLHQTYSCPQRRYGTEGEIPPPRLPAPRFSLEELRSDDAEDEELSGPRIVTARGKEGGGKKPAHTEVAEAAEAMILFMKSEPSSQHESSPPPPPLHSSAPESPTSLGRVLDKAKGKSVADFGTPSGRHSAADDTESDAATEPATSAASGSPGSDSDTASAANGKRARAGSETLSETSPQKRPCVS
ncbi:hypothetical protein GQ54DRAFT_295709 [Martensiomyces pterosporus]|nr:hypothetical protein GQ54DRAFT_295709 [Martensiomyces pterosporus]